MKSIKIISKEIRDFQSGVGNQTSDYICNKELFKLTKEFIEVIDKLKEELKCESMEFNKGLESLASKLKMEIEG